MVDFDELRWAERCTWASFRSPRGNQDGTKKEKKNKTDLSILLGEVLAKRASEKKINKVYFDRGGYKYHGRIKALAESLRKNGLNF